MASIVETVRLMEPCRTQDACGMRGIDDGAEYLQQALNRSQLATLQAILRRIGPENYDFNGLTASLQGGSAEEGWRDHYALASRAGGCARDGFNLRVGLDELDTIAHTRTGFSFSALTPEIQDAMLELVSTGDLAARGLDLRRWFDDLCQRSEMGLPVEGSTGDASCSG